MRRSWITLALLCAAVPVFAQPPGASSVQDDLAKGRRLYQAQCGRCHGIIANGGEGPDLAVPRLPRAPDEESLVSVILRGIPGTGMPGLGWLTDGDARQIAAYVRSLGRVAVAEVVGDPDRGRQLFETKGACTACHIVRGDGTAFGPDLSTVGARRGPDHLRESIVSPGAALPRGLTFYRPFRDFLTVRVVTRDGQTVRGMRVNESTFTIQLRDEAGRVHSFYKDSLRTLEKEYDESLMPTYSDVFSDAELDDLVAYLASLRGER